MHIGLDFDGVIADTTRLKQRIAKEWHNIEIPPERFKEYMVIEDGLMTLAEYRRLMNKVCGDMDAGLLMDEVAGAASHIRKLESEGNEFLVITSREGSELEVAKEWLAIRGIELPFISVGYGKDKADAAKGLDAYIDDDMPKLIPLAGIVPELFLFSQAHNLYHMVEDPVMRVDSWEELYKLIVSIKHGR